MAASAARRASSSQETACPGLLSHSSSDSTATSSIIGASSPGPLIGFHDAAYQRMANDVGGGEADRRDPFDAFQLVDGIREAGLGRVGQVDLMRVSANDHPAAHPEARQEHLHLQRRGVLRFVEDDERVVQGSAAHKGKRGDLDLAGGDATFDLLGGKHVVERIVERTQIGIDLLLHVARKEPEPLAGLDSGTRQDQAVDTARDELRHCLRDRQICLASAGRPKGEDHLIATKRFHIGRLNCGARNDRLLARTDHYPRRRGHFLLDDAVQVRLGCHAEHGFDRLGVDIVALVQAIVESGEDVARSRSRIGLTLDLHFVAPRRDVHAEPLLDRNEVAVVITEQGPEQVWLLELELETSAVGNGGKVAASHQAATFSAIAPLMLLGPAATSVTLTISPGWASTSTCTDWSHGVRPIIWPARLPFRSTRICVSVPTFERLNASWCSPIRSCSRSSRSSMSSRGIWSSITAAGVPGRGLYLNE